ncbi:MAG TPA: BPSS1780 family membrane protein [Casimicrobiaceae bacterium]|nr:BPSS1780 family membrane protein [Casimicrobiaceae bacterium]
MSIGARDIVFTRHAGARGVEWLVRSYAMFRKARMRWIAMLLAYYLALLLIDLVPLIGAWLAPVLKPVFAVGFLAAAWTQERGGAPELRHLLVGFRGNLKALLPLGVVLVLGVLISIGATALIDGGKLIDLLFHAPPAEMDDSALAKRMQETLAEPRVEIGMLFGALCALPTVLALWWAPALVVFQDAGVLTALGASLRAASANWRAILRYALAVFFFGGMVPSFISVVIALVLPVSMYPLVAAVLLLPYLCFFVATLHIADYVSYRDVFHAGETLAPLADGSVQPLGHGK